MRLRSTLIAVAASLVCAATATFATSLPYFKGPPGSLSAFELVNQLIQEINVAGGINFLEALFGYINIVNYGAKCDGVTDDSAAINAATKVVQGLGQTVTLAPWTLVGPRGPKPCVIKSSINLTGIVYHGGNVDLTLLCETNGEPCIDALGSRFINWTNLVMAGTSTSTPSIGLQVGRVGLTSPADNHVFAHVVLDGYYTVAAFYNGASETDKYAAPYINNRSTGASALVAILDGYNHWGVTSQFITSTWTPDTRASFNGNLFSGGQILGNASGSAIWIGGANDLGFDKTYIASTGTTAISLFCEDARCNPHLDFDIHVETPTVVNTFLLTGTTAAPVLNGFKYYDEQPENTGAVIALDSGVTSASIYDGDVRITSFYPSNTGPTMFDNPNNYTKIAGRFDLPTSGNWNPPSALNTFSGMLCISGSCTFASGGTLVISAGNISSTTNSGVLSWRNGGAFLSWPLNNTLQLGPADSATAVEQQLWFQSIAAGNGNTAAPNGAIVGPKSNGSGAGGDINIATTASAASSGVQNASATAFTIKGGSQLTQWNSSNSFVAASNCGSLSTATGCLKILDNNGNAVYIPVYGTL